MWRGGGEPGISSTRNRVSQLLTFAASTGIEQSATPHRSHMPDEIPRLERFRIEVRLGKEAHIDSRENPSRLHPRTRDSEAPRHSRREQFQEERMDVIRRGNPGR